MQQVTRKVALVAPMAPLPMAPIVAATVMVALVIAANVPQELSAVEVP